MNNIIREFAQAVKTSNGHLLANTLSPIAPKHDSGRLYALQRDTNAASVKLDFQHAIKNSGAGLAKEETKYWTDVYVAYWTAVGEILAAEESLNLGRNGGQSQGVASGAAPNWAKVYEAWKTLLNVVYIGYTKNIFEAWTIPCLYVTTKYLRTFAIKADEVAADTNDGAQFNNFGDDLAENQGENENLEDAARHINRVFALCISDRAPLEESRKWALYYITNILFKTYFKVGSITLSRNLIRSLQASAIDMPPLSAFPKSHQVTFNYYVGVIHFLDENYVKAQEHLTAAYDMCLASHSNNLKMILTYLIPTRMITTQLLPSAAMLAPSRDLQRLFGSLARCIRTGDLVGFDTALQAGDAEFTKRRIYLTLERGRDLCLRNLFRKVYLAGGYQWERDQEAPIRKSRFPIYEFTAALRMNGEREIESEEVECLIANMIYKNYMKAYISRIHRTVVVNKKGAFPGTGI